MLTAVTIAPVRVYGQAGLGVHHIEQIEVVDLPKNDDLGFYAMNQICIAGRRGPGGCVGLDGSLGAIDPTTVLSTGKKVLIGGLILAGGLIGVLIGRGTKSCY
jgi:hypothetical protein